MSRDALPITPRQPLKVDGARSAEVVQVIRTVALRGDGVSDPLREVIQYWALDGTFLAEHDEWPKPVEYGAEREEAVMM